jgi:hypothetical protein
MRIVIAGCAAGLVALAVGAGAGLEHTILHGVQVGNVHVWVGPDELPGVSQEQLLSSVEAQLREAGIQIEPDAPATLFTSVRVYTEPACFVTIESSLVEDALLERNGLRVPAQSWHSLATVRANTADECAQVIPEGVDRTVRDFIAMYSAMNPR